MDNQSIITTKKPHIFSKDMGLFSINDLPGYSPNAYGQEAG